MSTEEIETLKPDEVLDGSGDARLDELELVVARGLATFVEVGNALAEIRESRLYLHVTDSFERYCRERFGMTANYGRRQIAAAAVTVPIGTAKLPIPANESVARALSRAGDDAVEVWKQVLKRSGDKPPTAAAVEAVISKRRSKTAQTVENEQATENTDNGAGASQTAALEAQSGKQAALDESEKLGWIDIARDLLMTLRLERVKFYVTELQREAAIDAENEKET